MFASPDRATRKIVERQTVEEWGRSMSGAFGDDVSDITSVQQDPPDCTATFNGVPISVELSELLHGNVLHRIKRARLAGGPPPAFEELQWTPQLFAEQLNRIISTKQAKLARAGRDATIKLFAGSHR
jgi:hypothetical protein